jgi:pimeloyl-ACP methyl ester carboxylesterase
MIVKAFRTRWRQVARSWYMFFFLVPSWPERFLTADGAVNIVRMIKGSAIDRRHFTLEELQPYRDAALKPQAASAMVGWYRAAIWGARKDKRYPPVAARTLLIWGKEDKALGFEDLVPGTERYAPNLRVEQVEQCGHYVHEERPEQVNALLSAFLSAPL